MSLDRIISIERRTTTRDRFGGTIATWTNAPSHHMPIAGTDTS